MNHYDRVVTHRSKDMENLNFGKEDLFYPYGQTYVQTLDEQD